ncbi:hypothetical protein ONS95_006217 [Cadophora gregata]|uniref:uncharacterized protein n=1 Tax=Cadophora gregata TaxID=51156 RepID=UPI0026DC58CB|nr:uncharacterized protein ONS95_006217 [Cadophora gregata]KAK0102608.1 hypothetical protein ONS95_006217 [Cadophora gregata]
MIVVNNSLCGRRDADKEVLSLHVHYTFVRTSSISSVEVVDSRKKENHFNRLVSLSCGHAMKALVWPSLRRAQKTLIGSSFMIVGRLLAIKSVAAEMSMRIADTYIPFAGMWNGNLHFDLLWRALRDLSKPEQYRAPSWSWAAMDGPINWVNDLIDVHQNHTWLQRLPFSIIDLGESGLGVDRPFLKVRALLVPVAFIEECDHDERWLYGTRILPYDICIQSNKSTVEDQGKNIESLSLQDSFLSDINDGVIKIAEAQLDLDDTDNLTKSPRKLFYLHIQHTCRCTGLILEQEDENIELWKRVGVASICKTAPYSPFCPEFFEQHLELREVTLV